MRGESVWGGEENDRSKCSGEECDLRGAEGDGSGAVAEVA